MSTPLSNKFNQIASPLGNVLDNFSDRLIPSGLSTVESQQVQGSKPIASESKAANASIALKQDTRNLITPVSLFAIPATVTGAVTAAIFPAYIFRNIATNQIKYDQQFAKTIQRIVYSGSDTPKPGKLLSGYGLYNVRQLSRVLARGPIVANQAELTKEFGPYGFILTAATVMSFYDLLINPIDRWIVARGTSQPKVPISELYTAALGNFSTTAMRYIAYFGATTALAKPLKELLAEHGITDVSTNNPAGFALYTTLMSIPSGLAMASLASWSELATRQLQVNTDKYKPATAYQVAENVIGYIFKNESLRESSYLKVAKDMSLASVRKFAPALILTNISVALATGLIAPLSADFNTSVTKQLKDPDSILSKNLSSAGVDLLSKAEAEMKKEKIPLDKPSGLDPTAEFKRMLQENGVTAVSGKASISKS